MWETCPGITNLLALKICTVVIVEVDRKNWKICRTILVIATKLFFYFRDLFAETKKIVFLLKICTKFIDFFAFFSFLLQKILKNKILNSFWGAQHANAG